MRPPVQTLPQGAARALLVTARGNHGELETLLRGVGYHPLFETANVAAGRNDYAGGGTVCSADAE